MKHKALWDKSASFWFGILVAIVCLEGPHVVAAQQYPAEPQIHKDGTALLVEDYATLPASSRKKDGPYPAPIDYQDQLGRPNSFRSEPSNAPRADKRFFVVDQNGIIYILDKASRKFTPYIDIGKLYPKFATDPVYGLGVVSIQFDPDYANNGKFYTVHTEKPSLPGSNAPSNASLPGLNLTGFSTTEAIDSPAGDIGFQSILTEWTDTNINNATFEGSAREILRAGLNFGIHPMADLIFNPLAKKGDADYRNLYISVGDGAAGENAGVTHTVPQRLDALPGKILRITPDIALRPKDMLSSNGRYRIPSTGANANPFVNTQGARPEIYSYGHRNPLRLSWDPVTGTLIAAEVGNHSYEEINIIVKGGNYGWAEREGPEQHFVGGAINGKTGSQINPPVPFPDPDLLTVRGLEKPVKPLYPVAFYSHRDGVAMGSGFVYRGKLMPQMVGKYIFDEITTARVFYSDIQEMIATHGEHNKQAAIHEIQVYYKSPYDNSLQAPVKHRLYDIVADGFAHKGGTPVPGYVLPARGLRSGQMDPEGTPYGGGRADVRMSLGGDGEIYLLCKPDGSIRKLVGVVTPPPDYKKSDPSSAKVSGGR